MFETQIARGVALLDERRPGWETQIDLSKLDLSRMYFNPETTDPDWHCGCVLAQTGRAFGFGLYESGVGSYFEEFAALGYPKTADCGFSLVGGLDNNYEKLTAEWRLAILALRAERAVQEAVA